MRRRILAGLILVAVVAHSANAGTYTYSASGTLSNSGGLGLPPFPDGTTISIQFSIDSAAVDSNPGDTNVGQFDGLTGTFTLGGQTYSIDSYGFRYVEVTNNFSYYFGAGDWLRFFISTDDFSSLDTPVYNGARIHRLSLLMNANSTALFNSDALANSVVPDLGTLSGGFNMQAGDLVYINSDASGPATTFSSSVVPAAVDDDSIAVTEGVANIIPVGANDRNFTDPVTVTVTTPPTKGTISAVSAPGPAAGMTITYTANIGAVGVDSFVYSMADSTPTTDSATVTVNISPASSGGGGGSLDAISLLALGLMGVMGVMRRKVSS